MHKAGEHDVVAATALATEAAMAYRLLVSSMFSLLLCRPAPLPRQVRMPAGLIITATLLMGHDAR